MAERNPIEELDKALNAIAFGGRRAPGEFSREVGELAELAARLRDMPDETFRERLRMQLMTTAITDHTITPYLQVHDAGRLIEFLITAFGGQERFRMDQPSGQIHHAEVEIGDSIIELADAGEKYKAMPTAIHVFVDDVDAAYRRALDAGATILDEPADQPYGERSASVIDACGNHWYIAKHTGSDPLPWGMHAVNIYLHPKGAPAVIDFLKSAFDADEVGVYRSADDTVVHAKMRIGDSIIEMGEAHGPYQPMPAAIHLHVSNADEYYRRALQAGASLFFEPRDEPYGERVGGVTDPFGNVWYIANRLGEAVGR
jgi:PhnB protein